MAGGPRGGMERVSVCMQRQAWTGMWVCKGIDVGLEMCRRVHGCALTYGYAYKHMLVCTGVWLGPRHKCPQVCGNGCGQMCVQRNGCAERWMLTGVQVLCMAVQLILPMSWCLLPVLPKLMSPVHC